MHKAPHVPSVSHSQATIPFAAVALAALCCTMLTAPAIGATASYPGATGALMNTVLSGPAAPVPTQIPAQIPAQIPGQTAANMPDMDEPDNSPALFAARTELDVTPAKADMPQAASAPAEAHTLGEPDNSPALFESRRELEPVKDSSKINNVLASMLTPIVGGESQEAGSSEGAPVASYESPGVVVKTHNFKQAEYQPELSDREIQMASLNPASGTANDSGPLIQLPDPLPEPTAKPTAKPVVAQPVTAPAPAPVQETKPASASVAEPTAKPASTQKIETQKAEQPAAPLVAEPSEPRRELSPASKAIVNKIPANLDADKRTKKDPIALDRARNPQSTEGMVATESSAKHEEMGIKIEVRSPKIDLSYELEKAYNATIAGQTETAMDIYRNILHNDPNNRTALFGLGTLYHRAGQLDAARKLYSKLLSLEPNNRDALNNFLVLMSDEAPEAALEQLSRLEARDPKFSPIPAQMAIIYQKLGDMDKASEKMFRAVDLSPENLVYRYNLAIMLDKQQKYDEAGRLYHQIVEAYQRGESVPGNIQQIQQRLTFISAQNMTRNTVQNSAGENRF